MQQPMVTRFASCNSCNCGGGRQSLFCLDLAQFVDAAITEISMISIFPNLPMRRLNSLTRRLQEFNLETLQRVSGQSIFAAKALTCKRRKLCGTRSK
jgi:hypothetical protein